MAVEFIRSDRNSKLVVLENYIFRIKGKSGECSYWKCKVDTCNVRLKLKNDLLEKISGNHNHDPAEPELNRRLFKEKIRNRIIKEPTESIPKIYKEEVKKMVTSLGVALNTPSYNALKRSLYRTRAESQHPIPEILNDLSVSGSWEKTDDEKQKLLADDIIGSDGISTLTDGKSSVKRQATALRKYENGTGDGPNAQCSIDIEEKCVNLFEPTVIIDIPNSEDPSSENEETEQGTSYSSETTPTALLKPHKNTLKRKFMEEDSVLEDHLQIQRELLERVNELNKNIERNTEAQNSATLAIERNTEVQNDLVLAINNMSQTITNMESLLLAALERKIYQNQA